MRSRPKSIYYAIATITIASLTTTGCDKLTPNGQSDTMSLLKAGSDKVCVASDVQEALRDLILPKLDESASSELRAATKNFSVSFDLTTLQSADKTVNKAVCNTVAKMAGLATGERTFQITYQISPSAERSNAFVINGDIGAAHDFAGNEIGNIVAHQLAAAAQEQEAAEADKARQKLLTIITPRWLAGVWIEPTANATACADGHAFTFRLNHSFLAGQIAGQWALTADNLHLVGQGPTAPLDLQGTIATADPLSFSVKETDGTTLSLRRCTSAETASALPDVIAPPEPAQN